MARQYPLHHRYQVEFSMAGEASNKNTTYIPFFATDEGKTNPEDVNTNPRNDAYAGIQNTWNTYMGSRVSAVRIETYVNLDSQLSETVQAALYDACMVCTSFDDIRKDNKAGTTLGSILKLQEESSNMNQIHPIWNGTDLNDATVLPSDAVGLTTDQKIEGVSVDQGDLKDGLATGEFKGLLEHVMNGGPRKNIVYRDRPFYNIFWYNVKPKVVASNLGTFCGAYLHVPQMDDTEELQFYEGVDVDATIKFGYKISFNEYNERFDSA